MMRPMGPEEQDHVKAEAFNHAFRHRMQHGHGSRE
jgi:hypothetical protein